MATTPKILWGKFHRKPRASEAMDLPLVMRVLHLAFERCQRGGHAPFLSGELRRLLPYVDKQTGEVRPYSDERIREAIRALKACGYLAHLSSVRCLWVPMNVFDIDLKWAYKFGCPAHGHCLAYLDGETFDPEDINKTGTLHRRDDLRPAEAIAPGTTL